MTPQHMTDAQWIQALQFRDDGYPMEFIAARYNVNDRSLVRSLKATNRGYRTGWKWGNPLRCMLVRPWTAACMTPAEWASWKGQNPEPRVAHARRPCDDCPIGFAADMRALGLCNGSPMGVEEEDEAA